MKKVEEIRKKKEKERIELKEIKRAEKIKNAETFTYQTNEAFERFDLFSDRKFRLYCRPAACSKFLSMFNHDNPIFSYESAAPPLVKGDNPLDEIEKIPDFSQAGVKPAIKMKINFRAAGPEDEVDSEDSEGLPPVMEEHEARATSGFFIFGLFDILKLFIENCSSSSSIS